VWASIVLNDVFRDFPQCFEPIVSIAPQIMPQSLPSTSFPVHYLLFLAFYAMQPELLTASLKKHTSKIRGRRNTYIYISFNGAGIAQSV
jgi:hypothetical protein